MAGGLREISGAEVGDSPQESDPRGVIDIKVDIASFGQRSDGGLEFTGCEEEAGKPNGGFTTQ